MIIKVKVKPDSIEDVVRKITEDSYLIFVKEPAEDNKANKKVINLLAKEFNVSFKRIKIKNLTSKNKVIEIQ